MNAIDTSTIPNIPGVPFGGGFYTGRKLEVPRPYILIVSSKLDGDFDGLTWKKTRTSTKGARSLWDGHANTMAMNTANHPAAKACAAVKAGGFDDWFLGSKADYALAAEVFMPGTSGNPEQTLAEEFKEGGPQAFECDLYWTSTEFDAGCAWIQSFHTGGQIITTKSLQIRGRAFRKIYLTP
jgi:hypothetical protein